MSAVRSLPRVSRTWAEGADWQLLAHVRHDEPLVAFEGNQYVEDVFIDS